MKSPDLVASLRKRCQQMPGQLGFPESDDPRVLMAALEMLDEASVAGVWLFSERQSTLALAQHHGIDLGRHAGRLRWCLQDGDDSLGARLKHAATLLKNGELDAVLAGNTATTAEVIRVGIKTVGLAPGVRTVSGAFLMHRAPAAAISEQLYLFADCAVCVSPSIEQLADIGTESIRTWRCLVPDHQPVVALLSFSTKGSATHDAATRMQAAADLLRARHRDVEIDGELQFDAAFDATIGSRKAPGSSVPGRANIMIFPDLGSGNIAYKITQRLAGFAAYGPILQGLELAFSDLSRGASVADIRASAYVNLIRAKGL